MSKLKKGIIGAAIAFFGVSGAAPGLANQREADEQNYREVKAALGALGGADKLLDDTAHTANNAADRANAATADITKNLLNPKP